MAHTTLILANSFIRQPLPGLDLNKQLFTRAFPSFSWGSIAIASQFVTERLILLKRTEAAAVVRTNRLSKNVYGADAVRKTIEKAEIIKNKQAS